MERPDGLPYIDSHCRRVEATREQVWDALVSVLHARLTGAVAVPFARLVGVTPAAVRGDWHGTPGPGDSLPGFEVAEVRAPARLALRGEHRFAQYQLAFELDTTGETGPGTGAAECTLCARSWGAFPGLAGSGYRAVVIGTGAHRVLVRQLLRLVARRARAGDVFDE